MVNRPTHIMTSIARLHKVDLLLVCPITQERVVEPMICSDGNTYEYHAIQQWFDYGNTTSPLTGLPLPNRTLTPNRIVKQIVELLAPEIIDLTSDN